MLTLIDADLNTNPATVQTISVRAASATDPIGVRLVLSETGVDTGVFTSTATGLDLEFTFDESDEANARLQVREGDRVTAIYADALPAGTRTASATFAEYDSDGDGLPDWWERETFGGLEVSNGLTDFDGDADSDRHEWITGMSPTDPASRQQLWIEVRPGDGVLVRWNSVPGRRYTVRKSIGGLNGFFSLVEDIPASPGGVNEYRDILLPGAPSVFYSIGVRVEP